jgi:hypothetical protein
MKIKLVILWKMLKIKKMVENERHEWRGHQMENVKD